MNNSEKKPQNSLLTALVPDDLVTFPAIAQAPPIDTHEEIDLNSEEIETDITQPPLPSTSNLFQNSSMTEDLFSSFMTNSSISPAPLQPSNIFAQEFIVGQRINEDAPIPSAPPHPPSNQNNYRLSGNKPVYAHYPGLSAQSPIETFNSAPVPLPPQPIYSPQASPFEPFPPPQIPSHYIENVQVRNENEFSTPRNNGQNVTPHPPPLYNTLIHPHEFSPYRPVSFHWFYRKETEFWKPFSQIDSRALEEAFKSGKEIVGVEGGRYDVNLVTRLRQPIYWEETDSTFVQRCSWFYKGPMDSQFMPYAEDFSLRLEDEYDECWRTSVWGRRIELSGGEAIVLQSPSSFVHFSQEASADEWGSVPEHQLRPRTMRRGVDGMGISEGERGEVEHLVFLVHGIGSVCDFKFRSVVETVEDFRGIGAQLLDSHFKEARGRVEFLPVQWHSALHGEGGIDEKLKPLTLKSIPKLRHFTNDTLLDILFYTSPVYCQTIMDTVGNEMNRMYNLFLERNPNFNRMSVAVGGHSLGSLILFDLLSNQPKIVIPNQFQKSIDEEVQMETSSQDVTSSSKEGQRIVSYSVGSAGTGQPFIKYPVLDFHPTAFFAMGSPIAMFVAVRGLDGLGEEFEFPTCPAFFNIYHPYDPVAYRMESLVDPKLDLRPVMIPHHKGRKRFHLELKDTMARVGSGVKNRIMDSIRLTYRMATQLYNFTTLTEKEVGTVIESEIENTNEEVGSSSPEEKDIRIGSLNGGRRIDYVLQEAPHQILNEESEDTVLLIMNEILNEGRSRASTPEPSSQFDITSPTPLYFNPSPAAPVPYNSLPPPSLSQPPPQIPPHFSSLLSSPTSSYNTMSPVPLLIPPTTPPPPSSKYTKNPRPVFEERNITVGMDPTLPISSTSPSLMPPPPRTGFTPKK